MCNLKHTRRQPISGAYRLHESTALCFRCVPRHLEHLLCRVWTHTVLQEHNRNPMVTGYIDTMGFLNYRDGQCYVTDEQSWNYYVPITDKRMLWCKKQIWIPYNFFIC